MRLATLFVTTLLALSLVGCGVRGNLELPSAASVPEGEEPMMVEPEEDRPFILDGLLL